MHEILHPGREFVCLFRTRTTGSKRGSALGCISTREPEPNRLGELGGSPRVG
jgi:hypothetical protein